MTETGTATATDSAAPGETLLSVEHLVVEYGRGRRRVHAVSDMSFEVRRGETLGIVGESGCGKSSAARAIAMVTPPTSGRIVFDGIDLGSLAPSELRRMRRRVQMIFQDPLSSLNPRRKVRAIVGDPLAIWRRGTRPARRATVDAMLEAVGIDAGLVGGRRPVELSGGQCQRISLARALVLEPSLLVCDEPVASLDVSVQAQILNLVEDLKDRMGLTVVFIAHDLAVVRHVSDRVAVMYLGRLCELADADVLLGTPAHPYTAALLDSLPDADDTRRGADGAAERRGHLAGEPPSPLDPPSGCRFRTRCPYAQQRCADEEPRLRTVAEGQMVACHFPLVAPASPPEGPGGG